MLGVVCCTATALLAACGGEERSPRQAETTQRAAAQTTPAKPDLSDPNVDINTGRRLAPNPWRKPTQADIEPHPHEDVTRLVVREIKRGRGRATVRAGDWVFMDFIAATWKRGWLYNRAWKHERPFSTAGKILVPRGETRGLLRGMRGMRAGGRRQIIVPGPISGGIDADHPDYRTTTYWDVILRGFYARGCTPRGEPCRSGP
jgi:hypothetical protein